jgi:hypothetical protein
VPGASVTACDRVGVMVSILTGLRRDHLSQFTDLYAAAVGTASRSGAFRDVLASSFDTRTTITRRYLNATSALHTPTDAPAAAAGVSGASCVKTSTISIAATAGSVSIANEESDVKRYPESGVLPERLRALLALPGRYVAAAFVVAYVTGVRDPAAQRGLLTEAIALLRRPPLSDGAGALYYHSDRSSLEPLLSTGVDVLQAVDESITGCDSPLHAVHLLYDLLPASARKCYGLETLERACSFGVAMSAGGMFVTTGDNETDAGALLAGAAAAMVWTYAPRVPLFVRDPLGVAHRLWAADLHGVVAVEASEYTDVDPTEVAADAALVAQALTVDGRRAGTEQKQRLPLIVIHADSGTLHAPVSATALDRLRSASAASSSGAHFAIWCHGPSAATVLPSAFAGGVASVVVDFGAFAGANVEAALTAAVGGSSSASTLPATTACAVTAALIARLRKPETELRRRLAASDVGTVGEVLASVITTASSNSTTPPSSSASQSLRAAFAAAISSDASRRPSPASPSASEAKLAAATGSVVGESVAGNFASAALAVVAAALASVPTTTVTGAGSGSLTLAGSGGSFDGGAAKDAPEALAIKVLEGAALLHIARRLSDPSYTTDGDMAAAATILAVLDATTVALANRSSLGGGKPAAEEEDFFIPAVVASLLPVTKQQQHASAGSSSSNKKPGSHGGSGATASTTTATAFAALLLACVSARADCAVARAILAAVAAPVGRGPGWVEHHLEALHDAAIAAAEAHDELLASTTTSQRAHGAPRPAPLPLQPRWAVTSGAAPPHLIADDRSLMRLQVADLLLLRRQLDDAVVAAPAAADGHHQNSTTKDFVNGVRAAVASGAGLSAVKALGTAAATATTDDVTSGSAATGQQKWESHLQAVARAWTTAVDVTAAFGVVVRCCDDTAATATTTLSVGAGGGASDPTLDETMDALAAATAHSDRLATALSRGPALLAEALVLEAWLLLVALRFAAHFESVGVRVDAASRGNITNCDEQNRIERALQLLQSMPIRRRPNDTSMYGAFYGEASNATVDAAVTSGTLVQTLDVYSDAVEALYAVHAHCVRPPTAAGTSSCRSATMRRRIFAAQRRLRAAREVAAVAAARQLLGRAEALQKELEAAGSTPAALLAHAEPAAALMSRLQRLTRMCDAALGAVQVGASASDATNGAGGSQVLTASGVKSLLPAAILGRATAAVLDVYRACSSASHASAKLHVERRAADE